jgi:hypothetical protein
MITITMGDIGEEQEIIHFEPIPETVPAEPILVPAEPELVPA